MKRKGFGLEDSPFMILATVAVMLLTVWIGVNVLGSFVNGNDYQAAVEASSGIYKRARLVGMGYDGSSDRLFVSVPQGYAVLVDGCLVAVRQDGNTTSELTERMVMSGVAIHGVNGPLMGPGDHDVTLTYSKNDGISVYWD